MTETKQKENQTSDCIKINHFSIAELRKYIFSHLYVGFFFFYKDIKFTKKQLHFTVYSSMVSQHN